MEFNNSGLTDPKELIDYLDKMFAYEVERTSDSGSRDFGLSFVGNHKGNWTVAFEGMPEIPVLLVVFTYFETVQNWDGLEWLHFYHKTPKEISFENIAGCLADNQANKLGAILSISEAHRRAEFEKVKAKHLADEENGTL